MVDQPERQRVAAYAELRDAAGRVLLVKAAAEIGDRWFLPGGGIQFGESPEAALHREVLEETGLTITDVELVTVSSDVYEWRGEQVHSLRIIFRATPVDPEAPLTHEVGGSTVRAQWFRADELAALPLSRYVAQHLRP